MNEWNDENVNKRKNKWMKKNTLHEERVNEREINES